MLCTVLLGHVLFADHASDITVSSAGVDRSPPAAPPALPAASLNRPGAAPVTSDASSGWQSGMFDAGSWMECQSGWARTVVTGRARLGGFAVGVIGVEATSVTRHIPADPGMPESSETNILQAGQVRCRHHKLQTTAGAASRPAVRNAHRRHASVGSHSRSVPDTSQISTPILTHAASLCLRPDVPEVGQVWQWVGKRPVTACPATALQTVAILHLVQSSPSVTRQPTVACLRN